MKFKELIRDYWYIFALNFAISGTGIAIFLNSNINPSGMELVVIEMQTMILTIIALLNGIITIGMIIVILLLPSGGRPMPPPQKPLTMIQTNEVTKLWHTIRDWSPAKLKELRGHIEGALRLSKIKEGGG